MEKKRKEIQKSEKPKEEKKEDKKKESEKLDEELEQTFPASDPPSRTKPSNDNETGLLLLDDSSRKEYNEGIDYARRQGFKSLTFSGLKPTGIGVDETTIFYRTQNCFGI